MRYLKVEICVEHLVAYIAAKPFHSTMDFNVLVQVCSLSKAKPTVRHGTYIRPLLRVDSQMIKEIVPFSEPFFAVFMVALQNLNMSFWTRVLISKDSKLLGVRYMLLDLNGAKIKCSPRLNCNHHIATDFIESLANFSESFSFHLYLSI